jgi:hypothetical protein
MYYLSLPIGCASVSDGAFKSVLFKDPKPLRVDESNPEPRAQGKATQQLQQTYQVYERDEEKVPAEYIRDRLALHREGHLV